MADARRARAEYRAALATRVARAPQRPVERELPEAQGLGRPETATWRGRAMPHSGWRWQPGCLTSGWRSGGTLRGGRRTPAHPYLERQMLGFGFRQTLEVRTLGCARRSLPYRSTSDPLV